MKIHLRHLVKAMELATLLELQQELEQELEQEQELEPELVLVVGFGHHRRLIGNHS